MIKTLIPLEIEYVFGGANDCSGCLNRNETITLCKEIYKNHTAINPPVKPHELNTFGIAWRTQQTLAIAAFIGYFTYKALVAVAKAKVD